MPFAGWIKAILRPHAVLSIPAASVHEFQISTLVLMDNIWLACNKLLFETAQPVPSTLLKRIKTLITHHMEAWCLRHPIFSLWLPPPLGTFKVNFDVAVRSSFAVAAATLTNHLRKFFGCKYFEASFGEC